MISNNKVGIFLKQILILCFVVILLSSTTTFAETSKSQASEIVDKYVTWNTTARSYGPYDYQGDIYFAVEIVPKFNPDAYIATLFIIDAKKGDVVLDRNIYYEVSKMHLTASAITYWDYHELYSDNLVATQEDINYWENSEKFWNEIDEKATKTEEKNAAKEAASLCNELTTKFENELLVSQNIVDTISEIHKDAVTDVEITSYADLETQLNENYKDSQKSVRNAINKLPSKYDEFADSNFDFDVSPSELENKEAEDLRSLGDLNDYYGTTIFEYQSTSEWAEDETDWLWESMNDIIVETSELDTRDSTIFGLVKLEFPVAFAGIPALITISILAMSLLLRNKNNRNNQQFMKNQRKFSLRKITEQDYSAGVALSGLLIVGFFYILTNHFGYMISWSGIVETSYSDWIFFRNMAIFAFSIGLPFLIWRFFFFYNLYKYGVEVTGNILLYGRFRLPAKAGVGAKAVYEYAYQNEKYVSGNGLSVSASRKHIIYNGDEVVLIVDPQNPKRAVIRDIYF